MVEGGMETFLSGMIGAAVKGLFLFIVSKNHRKRFVHVGEVSAFYCYPVKSCGALTASSASLTKLGVQIDGLTDRQWMIVSDDDKILTMKEEPRLSCLKPDRFNNFLRLQAPGMQPLCLDETVIRKGGVARHRFFKEEQQIISCGEEADRWISEYLNRSARLVYSCEELGTRNVYDRKRKWNNYAKPQDVGIFSYLTSYMITTSQSLIEINEHFDTPVEDVNFRPNIVIKTNTEFDEDYWSEVRIGSESLFHAVEPCRRCVITTIDPQLGKRREDGQPLLYLRKTRCRHPYGSSPIFGLYISLDVPGQAKVGDPVYAIRRKTAI